MANQNTFFIKSMGCKSNQFEGDLIVQNLVEAGFCRVYDVDEAKYYILNSCSVTHKSESESLYLLRNVKNKNKSIKTVITGCVAQLEKDSLLKTGFVDYVIGNDDKLHIADLISADSGAFVSDIMSLDKFSCESLKSTNKTRYSLKIQDGCNSRCSYCIIPFARGKSRSADTEFIINQINTAVLNGFKEVVFTGIHIGQWGVEFGKTILDLLRQVEERTNIPRFRLGSLNPSEINSELLDFLQNSEKFCPHFHLSLQSACDKTLKSMNRFYSTAQYLEMIEDITSRFERPFIGSDIIVGFAGETESDFMTTVENLEKSKLTKIHTFPYSVRNGTQAEKMEGHLPPEVKQKRAEIIKEISNRKYQNFVQSNISTVGEVLIEKRPDKKTNLLKGVTGNYLEVLINDTAEAGMYYNTLQKIKIEKADASSIYGTIL